MNIAKCALNEGYFITLGLQYLIIQLYLLLSQVNSGCMNIRNKYCLLLIGYICFISCNNMPSKSHGPITLGDSSTIVTEKDPARLQDMVTDLNPVIPAATVPVDTPKPTVKPSVDTAKHPTASVATPPPAAPLPSGPGLKAEFKDVTVVIPNLNAKLAGKPNLMNANGAVYTWASGNLNGNVLHTTGGVGKVSQRYQCVPVLRSKNGNLPLESLSETTPWKQVNGGNGSFPITGLSENELTVPDADAGDIRSAISKSCKARRYSHKKLEEYLREAGNAKAANQRPLVVTVRSVMWKIDGKDPSGKIFSKQIRIDVPM